MKVICIANKSNPDAAPFLPPIEIGQEYNAVDFKKDPYNGELHYHLEEFPVTTDGRTLWWWSKNFALTSSIDETTFERNCNKEIV